MAPAHAQTQQQAASSSVSSITYTNFAVGSGTNRTLVAYVLWRDDTGNTGDPPYCSSVVFNTNENFTFRVRGRLNYATNNYLVAEVWTLDNPTNATANVVAALSEANDAEDGAVLVISEYTGANNGIGANTGNATGNDTQPRVTFTTTTSTGLIVAGAAKAFGTAGSFAPGTDTVERIEGTIGTGGLDYFAAEEPATQASQQIDETHSTASTRWAIAAVELLAAVAGGVEVEPAAASAVAAVVAPTVQLGSLALSPTATSTVAAIVAPTVQLGSMSIELAVAVAIAGITDPTVQITGGGEQVTPGPASAVAAIVAPTVQLGSMSIELAVAVAIAGVVAPTVQLGSMSIEPAVAVAVAGVVAPTVQLGSLSIEPVAAAVIGVITSPAVQLGSVSIELTASAAVAGITNPTVQITGGNVEITPATADAVGAMVAPTVQLGSLVLTPVAAAAVAVVVQPTVQITGGNVEITPAAVTVIAWAVLGGAQGGEPDKTSNLAWILFIRL